ncbi:hypothetical protein O6H91_04G114700 [Diphasiastrum complanatum]|uniref:Uncharacterized protein n=1 Tax=Diphasiastrum complanatum TaxID=34168 RepID=A0ACC2E155_DIPCM|nr:hypothetical protein O6H91_04G114700 [Diphasiastrum complanatum]
MKLPWQIKVCISCCTRLLELLDLFASLFGHLTMRYFLKGIFIFCWCRDRRICVFEQVHA